MLKRIRRTVRYIAGFVIAVIIVIIPAAFGEFMEGRGAVIIDPAPNGMDMLRVPESQWRNPDGTMIEPALKTLM